MSTLNYTISEKSGSLKCDPPSQTAVTRNTTLQFVLSGTAATTYEITGYTSNDQNGQLGAAQISGDGVTMTIPDVNNQSVTIQMTVNLAKRKGGLTDAVGPVVVNDPP